MYNVRTLYVPSLHQIIKTWVSKTFNKPSVIFKIQISKSSSWFQPISKIGSSLWIIFPKKSGWKKWPRWPTWFHGFIRHLRRETSLDPIGTWNFVEENQPTPQRIHRCRGHSLPQGVEWTRGVSRFKPLRPKAKDGCGVFWKIAGFFLILEKKLPLV